MPSKALSAELREHSFSPQLIWAAHTLPAVPAVCQVDALLGRRNSLKEHEALREMKNEFMSCWDGIRGTQSSRVSGGTFGIGS